MAKEKRKQMPHKAKPIEEYAAQFFRNFYNICQHEKTNLQAVLDVSKKKKW